MKNVNRIETSRGGLPIGRREFLSVSALLPFILGRTALAQEDRFRFLVIGDSLVWGQGLNEPDKFYSLTQDWLEREHLLRPVDLKVKAHSGATLKPVPEEAEAFRRTGFDATRSFHPEINVSIPTIGTQIDQALAEYRSENAAPESVGLIMISGGITDISVATILNPFGDNDKLREDIPRSCRDSLGETLSRCAAVFPNARIAVIGYFPMVSPKTSKGQLFNFILEAYGFPRPLKPVANNPLTRQLFKIVRGKAIRRSRIWAELSDRYLGEAVANVNRSYGACRAVLVKAPITEETCFGTERTLVFRMLKKGRIEDAVFDKRLEVCAPALDELRRTTGLRYRRKFCEGAAIGHPNAEGSKAFFESIRSALSACLPGVQR